MSPTLVLRLATVLCVLAWAPCAAAAQETYAELLARPRPAADHRIAYGQDPDQFGELWLPKADGPRPVVVLIHGGCWQESLPGLELMDYAAASLRRRGYAVWNLEYRRLGRAGGGYPGTFEDVARGVDALRGLARSYPLDLRRVVLVGHSAGGQLALWAAAQSRRPAGGPGAAPPLPVAGVVSLAGIDDLEAYHAKGPAACGGPGVVEALVGAPGRSLPAAFANTSPAAMLPLGVPQVIVSGEQDPIVPPAFGSGYAAKARRAGDDVRAVVVPHVGHFELIDPLSDAWRPVAEAIRAMLRATPSAG